MVKLTVFFGHPKDAAPFEKYFTETFVPFAKKVQGVKRIELAKARRRARAGRATPFYRSADLYFDDAKQLRGVMASEPMRKTVADFATFATGGVTIVMSDVE